MKATFEKLCEIKPPFFPSEAAAQVKAEKDVLPHTWRFERRDRGWTQIGEQAEAWNIKVTMPGGLGIATGTVELGTYIILNSHGPYTKKPIATG
jgi:hypothetical protein